MQRVKRSTAVAVLPAEPAGGTPGYFASPNPGGGVVATVPGFEWFNAVQEEIVNVILAAGMALDGTVFNQMEQAIVQLASTAAPKFPAGTRMPFAQAAAPAGWTQDVSDNADNRMLRVVKTAGNGVGGVASPILNNVVPAHTHGFTTGNQSADHAHSGSTGNVSNDHTHNFTAVLDIANQTRYSGGPAGLSSMGTTSGASANHTHAFTTGGASTSHTHSGSTDNGSSQTNWVPRYIDLIICSKD
jgi:hypothetical protein